MAAVVAKIKAHRELLIKLARAKNNAQRRKVLKEMSADGIALLVEIVCNCLANKIKLSSYRLRKLRPHKKVIRKISGLRTVNQSRKALMIGGSFIPHLLLPLLAVVMGRVVDHALRK
jgi:hypothetical protein